MRGGSLAALTIALVLTTGDVGSVLARSPAAASSIALVKLRKPPPEALDAEGTRSTGLRSLDVLLEEFDAWAFAAFPFDRGATRDGVGLDRWIVIALPPSADASEAARRLRADRSVYPESYLPEDAGFREVAARGDWPARFLSVRRRAEARTGGAARRVSRRHYRELPRPGAAASAIRAPEIWPHGQGRGVGIAVIDTGVDANHRALVGRLRGKNDDHPGRDADGNGVPADASGANFAHLAIARRDTGPPFLGLGLVRDTADWDGAFVGRPRAAWGHGTAIAALAGGSADAGFGAGVAPRSWLLAVDVQENPAPAESPLAERDPRQTAVSGGSTPPRPPRGSVWSLAAGVVYAVAEGARVLTCAWPEQEPHWLLHDALLFAEENCALPVCSGATPGFPADWREASARARGAGTGELRDALTGEVQRDFFLRPLRGLLHVGDVEQADLRAPAVDARTALSNPTNDATPLADTRSLAPTREVLAVGLAAGAAALAFERRPDLDGVAVRRALIAGSQGGVLSVPEAIEWIESAPEGRCQEPIGHPAAAESEPFWKRIKIRARYGVDPGGPGPISTDRDEESDEDRRSPFPR